MQRSWRAMMRLSTSIATLGRTTKTHGSLLRDKLRGEQNLIVIFGSEIRGSDIASLVNFGSAICGAKFLCLADYANSRGAADMGLYPDLLPGYHPTAGIERVP